MTGKSGIAKIQNEKKREDVFQITEFVMKSFHTHKKQKEFLQSVDSRGSNPSACRQTVAATAFDSFLV